MIVATLSHYSPKQQLRCNWLIVQCYFYLKINVVLLVTYMFVLLFVVVFFQYDVPMHYKMPIPAVHLKRDQPFNLS